MNSIEFFDVENRTNAIVVHMRIATLREGVDSESIKLGLLRVVEQYEPEQAVIDFSRVKFFSSSVFSILLNVRRQLNANGGVLKLSGMNDSLIEVCGLMGLSELLRSYETIDEALMADC